MLPSPKIAKDSLLMNAGEEYPIFFLPPPGFRSILPTEHPPYHIVPFQVANKAPC